MIFSIKRTKIVKQQHGIKLWTFRIFQQRWKNCHIATRPSLFPLKQVKLFKKVIFSIKMTKFVKQQHETKLKTSALSRRFFWGIIRLITPSQSWDYPSQNPDLITSRDYFSFCRHLTNFGAHLKKSVKSSKYGPENSHSSFPQIFLYGQWIWKRPSLS